MNIYEKKILEDLYSLKEIEARGEKINLNSKKSNKQV